MSDFLRDEEDAYLKQLEEEDKAYSQQTFSKEEDDEDAYLKQLEEEDKTFSQSLISQDIDDEDAYLKQLEEEDKMFAGDAMPPAPPDATAVSPTVEEQPPQPTPNQDAALIEEYLQDTDAFYTEEYLSSLDTQKLSEVISEEKPNLVEKYYPLSGQGLTAREIEDISGGATLQPYEQSYREKAQSVVAGALQKVGVASDNFIAQQMAQDFVGNPNASSLLESLSLADLTPANAVFMLNEIYREVDTLSQQEDTEATDYILPTIFAALSILEGAAVTKGIAVTGKGMLKSAVEVADDIEKKAFRKTELGKSLKKLTDAKKAKEQTREAFFKKKKSKFDVGLAREAEAATRVEKAAAAKKIADDNSDIQEELILQFERNNDVVISKKGKDGKLRVDPKKAREAGKSIIDETAMIIDPKAADEASVAVKEAQKEIGGFSNPRLLELVLQKDKLDAVTAVIAQVKKANPDAFKGVDKKKTMDVLFDESVKGNLFASDELRDILNTYGISMDDYIMMTVGSATKFGQGLQKFAQMRKAMGGTAAKAGATSKNEDELRRSAENLNKIVKNVKRGENVIRGAMVSAFATAARNFESALVRYPTEGLTNLMEEAIKRAGKGFQKATVERADRAVVTRAIAGVTEAAKEGASAINPFGKRAAFKDSFAMYGYTFGDRGKVRQTGASALSTLRGDKLSFTGIAGKELTSDNAEFVDYLLMQPEFKNLFSRFYDQVNEVMAYTGRGEGGISDKIFEPVEDLVQFLNGPNRLQEFVTRRAYFRTDLSMALKREWGIDLEDALQNGKIRELINDSPDLQPPGARSFKELMAEATDKALQKTYAAPPDFVPFKYALKVLNSIPGSTFVLPFPRFMFKSMEYVGEVVAGMPIAMVRRFFPDGGAAGKRSRDAEIAARNIAGIASLGMAYMAVGHEDSPVNYKKVRTFVSDKVVDISTQYPLPQLMYIASWAKKFFEGGEGDAMAWYRGQGGGREFVKLFTGTNFKQNQALGNLLDDLAAVAAEESKLGTGARMANAAGAVLGDISTRILQPYTMVIDAERAFGMRTTEVKDFRGDPDLDAGSAFVEGFMRPAKQRGILGGEEERPAKQIATREDSMERIRPELKLLAGLTVQKPDTPQQEFLQEIGIPVYEFDSKTGIGTLDRIINDSVNDFLPNVVSKYMRQAEQMRERGDTEEAIRIRISERIKTRFKDLRAKIRRVSAKAGDDPGYIRALLDARRMPLEKQRRAIFEFEQSVGRDVDLSNTADLRAIYRIGRKLK